MTRDEALRIVRHYEKQLERGEKETNRDTLQVAEAFAVLRADDAWYEEMVTEDAAKGPHPGRPPEDSDWGFGRWVQQHHASHVTSKRTIQLLGAHRTVKEYLEPVPHIPTSERQVRPLYGLIVINRGFAIPDVWARAVEIADGDPTHMDVTQAVREWKKANVPAAVARKETKRVRAARLRRRIEQEIDRLIDDMQAEAEAGHIVDHIVAKIRKRQELKVVS